MKKSGLQAIKEENEMQCTISIFALTDLIEAPQGNIV